MSEVEEKQFEIGLITKDTDTSGFDCGNDELNNYIRKYAKQNIRDKTAVCYGLFEDSRLVGFYAISASSVLAKDFLSVSKGVSKYQLVPVLLLGRLAVDKNYKNLGFGKWLVFEAMEKTLDTASQVGCKALIVDAIDEQAVSFYKKYDFKDFPGDKKLFIEVDTISTIFGGS